MDNLLWITPAAIVGVALAGALVKWLLWIGSMNEHKSAVTDLMAEIRVDIKKILRRLPADPVDTTSPLSLTGFGQEIAEAVGASAWAREHAGAVKNRVVGKAPYEVEDISFASAREEHELSPSMREVMYEHGYSHDHVRSVLGVVLRDELLSQAVVA